MFHHFDKFPLAAGGWRYVAGYGGLTAVALALDVWWLAVPLALLTLLFVWFFRDPARETLAGPRVVLAPADGRVVMVGEVAAPELPRGRALLVSIFMNLLDVHVNRLPVSGRVIQTRHLPGGFLPADRAQARQGNERQETLIATADGEQVLLAQVAGLVARRITCRLLAGDWVLRGQRFGDIRFGSRVDLYLPTGAKLQVRPGELVKAGVSRLGEL